MFEISQQTALKEIGRLIKSDIVLLKGEKKGDALCVIVEAVVILWRDKYE